MSPYRVFVKKRGSRKRTVLQAMLKTDKETKERRIHIVEKIGYLQSVDISARQLAHKQTNALNSDHKAVYKLHLSEVDNMYSVGRRINDSIWFSINGKHFTQADCLVAAMEDFCRENRYEIIQIL